MTRTSDYWNRPDVVTAFAAAPAPGYLAEIVPVARPGAVAIDVGCGGGRNLPLLTARGYRVIGTDLHAEMLQRAGRSAGTVSLHRTDVAALPFASHCADVVVCHGVLHNLTSPGAVGTAIAELHRVLAVDGILSLNLFSSAHLDPRLTSLGQHGFRLPNGQVMTLLPTETIGRLCAETGLSVIDGPHVYLRGGDPGRRAVWRAVLRPTGTVR